VCCCWQFHCNTCASSFWWIDQNRKGCHFQIG
jgi:hypothetical protein